ncbi:MAG TPA: PIN domain-containing protein [Thermoanaerobaculia bacterium]
MKKILVDTNVLLSFLTDRSAEQQEQATALFQQAAAGEHILVVHQMGLVEMVHVLLNFYRVNPEETAGALGDLLAMPGLQVINEIAWPLVLELWPRQIPTFVDAAHAAVARHADCDAVATFDGNLSKRLKRQGLTVYW